MWFVWTQVLSRPLSLINVNKGFTASKIFLLSQRYIKMTSKLWANKAIDEMKTKNAYFEKYAEKIAQLQQISPNEFIARMEKLVEMKVPNKQETERNYTELLQPKGKLVSPEVKAPEAKLADVMKMDLIQDKTAKEIEHIWIEYHKNKDVIVATIPVQQYQLMSDRGNQFPVFIFPLPRTEGYEFILLQFSKNRVHFTPLLCYQVHKENSPECLNITHYTDLQDKAIILMRGEFDKNVLNAKEAQCLANQLQLYYSQSDQSKLALLGKFNKNPDSFKHMDLIKEFENIKI